MGRRSVMWEGDENYLGGVVVQCGGINLTRSFDRRAALRNRWRKWLGWKDSNLQPPEPESDATTN